VVRISLNIGILGSGDVAQALGKGFRQHGHAVMLGTRDAKKPTEWRAKTAGAKVGSFADAAKFGEAVVLAVKGAAALDSTRRAGRRCSSAGTMRRRNRR
jgi:predicted dinucleotide-binding enzyme